MLHIPARSNAPVTALIAVAGFQDLDVVFSPPDGHAILLPCVEIFELRCQRFLRQHQQSVGGRVVDQAAFHIQKVSVLVTVRADLLGGLVCKLIDLLPFRLLFLRPGVLVKRMLLLLRQGFRFKQIVKNAHVFTSLSFSVFSSSAAGYVLPSWRPAFLSASAPSLQPFPPPSASARRGSPAAPPGRRGGLPAF